MQYFFEKISAVFLDDDCRNMHGKLEIEELFEWIMAQHFILVCLIELIIFIAF